MLHGSTRRSGITAGHDTPYRFLTVDLPRSAPLRDQSLCYLGEGALGPIRRTSLRRGVHPLRFPLGGTRNSCICETLESDFISNSSYPLLLCHMML